ncbi:hypothetical protein BDN72DRAFT_961870 [Pluteus cervinus]|uniref:Uncharacterized protein n=1 Tax=Pluteus cervinus TaxID=181527 RepID=A0ACD3AKJ4_9AGAR|nr:hypothetical protein BDN72DRAFT_961870 [Pluteus cervinus]
MPSDYAMLRLWDVPSVAPSLFHWLLHRPARMRNYRMHLIISRDPWGVPDEHVHKDTKIKISYASNVFKRMARNHPSVLHFIASRGRKRPWFRRSPPDYPESSEWFGIVDPLPPNLQPLDVLPILKQFAEYFKKADWGTEHGTKKSVEELEEVVKDLLRYRRTKD